MNVVMSVCEHERELALAWMEWCAELGAGQNHKLYLLLTHGWNGNVVVEAANHAFPEVSIISDGEKISSNWQEPTPGRSAAGPNSSFRQVCWHFYLQKLGPFFFCETDCILLKKESLDQIELAYASCGKPFLGANVEIDRVPPHLSGNACYPQNVPELAPTLIMHTNATSDGKVYELAFDIAGAQEVLKQAAFTNLIQHRFRHPGFKSREEFEALIDPQAAVFHSCKDGSIYQFLRGGDVKFRDVSAQTVCPESISNGAEEVQPSTAPESRETLVRDTVAILKQLATAPRYISQVRKELKAQGIVK